MADTWLTNKHPSWLEQAHEWQFALDHLEGDVFGENERTRFVQTGQGAASPSELEGRGWSVYQTAHTADGDPVALEDDTDAVSSSVNDAYLIKRSQGETDEAYRERRRLASYTPYFLYAVISLAGDLFSQEEEGMVRTWQPEDAETGLGDPDEPGTVASILSDNYNGKGASIDTVMRRATVDLIATKTKWAVAEGTKKDDEDNRIDEAAVEMVSPLAADNWREEGGRLVEAKVVTRKDVRDSIKDDIDEARARRFTVYDLDGWTRYKLDEDDNEVEVASGEYEFYMTSNQRQKRLPIFSVDVPVRGNPGYLAARQANSLFNGESAIDFSLWIASFAKLFADVQDENGNLASDLWDEFQEAIKNGQNVLPGAGHTYDGPPSNHIEAYQSRLDEKKADFYRTFFQSFADSAAEKTATEIRQERKQGVEAYLTLLTNAVEELENTAGFLLEQVYFPDQPDVWGQYNVTRSTNFELVDTEKRVENMVKRFFPGGKVPVDTETMTQAALRAIEHSGLEVPEGDQRDDLRNQIQQMVNRETQARSLQQDFGA